MNHAQKLTFYLIMPTDSRYTNKTRNDHQKKPKEHIIIYFNKFLNCGTLKKSRFQQEN